MITFLPSLYDNCDTIFPFFPINMPVFPLVNIIIWSFKSNALSKLALVMLCPLLMSYIIRDTSRSSLVSSPANNFFFVCSLNSLAFNSVSMI